MAWLGDPQPERASKRAIEIERERERERERGRVEELGLRFSNFTRVNSKFEFRSAPFDLLKHENKESPCILDFWF